MVTSVVSNVEDSIRISGGKLGILEMALRSALNTVNQLVLKRALMAKCWDHPKLCT